METITRNGITIPIGMHYGKNIIIASDHRGYNAKLSLVEHLKKMGSFDCVVECKDKFLISDVGNYSLDRCDFVDYAAEAALAIGSDWLNTVGIAICGSGIGMAIASGKTPRVYSARCLSLEDAMMSRKHNNSNFLCLSATNSLNKDIISAWLLTKFYASEDDEPYLERFVKLIKLEDKYMK